MGGEKRTKHDPDLGRMKKRKPEAKRLHHFNSIRIKNNSGGDVGKRDKSKLKRGISNGRRRKK